MRSMRAAFEERYSSAKLPLTLSFRETLRQARRAAQQGRQPGIIGDCDGQQSW